MVYLTDISLVTQVAVFGNRKAFDQLVVKYQSPVRRFLMHLTLGDSQLSDDLAQDTFIKAYVNIRQFRGTASFSTWLMRIAYNVFYDYNRSLAPNPALTGEGSKVMEQAENSLSSPVGEGPGVKLDLYAALAILKPDERTCITLQLVDGFPINEIADITGLPVGTVKSHLKRGKDKLTIYLKQNGYERK
ncbi:MAG: sigma-70 family RNA polymerase sigma factor [Prevotella sp.]|nr:sigma-70 family RNA polymerase sigma factor [Prevotella sp.]